jgi:hypothetical protein
MRAQNARKNRDESTINQRTKLQAAGPSSISVAAVSDNQRFCGINGSTEREFGIILSKA